MLNNDLYQKKNINFNSLLHLQDIGLIQFTAISSYTIEGFSKYSTLSYYDKVINLEFKKDKENELDIGNVLLTQSGQELFSICQSEMNDDFFMFILEEWNKQGIIISEQLKVNKS